MTSPRERLECHLKGSNCGMNTCSPKDRTKHTFVSNLEASGHEAFVWKFRPNLRHDTRGHGTHSITEYFVVEFYVSDCLHLSSQGHSRWCVGECLANSCSAFSRGLNKTKIPKISDEHLVQQNRPFVNKG